MIKKTFIFFCAVSLIFIATASYFVSHASAQTLNGTAGNGALNGTAGNGALNGTAGNGALNGTAGNGALNGTAGNSTLINPLSVKSVCGLFKALFNVIITLAVPIIIFFIVFAGFKFVLARGSPDKLKSAKENLMWTILGIAIFLGAWTLAMVLTGVINDLNKAGGGSTLIGSC